MTRLVVPWVVRLAHHANMVSVAVSGCVMGLMALHVVADVCSRYFIGHPLNGTTEIVSRYYMVALVFLPLAYVQANTRHIEATLLSDLLPARAQVLLGCLSALLMGTFAGLLGWRTGVEALRATAISEQIQTAFYFLPTWPARWLPTLAMTLVLLQSIVDLAVKTLRFLNWHKDYGSMEQRDRAQVTPL